MTEELGCGVCRAGVYSGGEPHFLVATTPTDLLYRCAVCGTWWVGDGRSAHAATVREASKRFPTEVTG